LESYHKALAIRSRLARDNPAVTEFQSDLAESYLNVGNLEREKGYPNQAIESYSKALAINERLARENPSVITFQIALALGHNNVGAMQRITGHSEQALQSHLKALAIREWLARENASVDQFQSDLGASHNNLGALRHSIGDLDPALESYEKGLTIFQGLARKHPDSVEYATHVAVTLHNMAMIDLLSKHVQQARDKLREAISWERMALGAYPKLPTYLRNLEGHLTHLVQAATTLGLDDEARAARRELAELTASDPAMVELDRRVDAVLHGQAAKDNR
jgi:tetratricopeptide (TPR) repeat protein